MKQRLVGAIVLVALAVIFLPMLLDGSGQSGPRDVAIDIPEQPQPPRNRLSRSEASGTDNTDAATGANANPSSSADSRQGTTTEEPMAADDDAGSAAAAEQPPPVEADPAQSAKSANESDAAESGSGGSPTTDETSTETTEAEDTDTDASGTSESADAASTADAEDSGPTSWVVQVGSFGRETNALVLRDRLRELGFDAFVEQGETDQGAVWRVRVGPVASRDAADRLSERVTEERGGSVLVMTHP